MRRASPTTPAEPSGSLRRNLVARGSPGEGRLITQCGHSPHVASPRSGAPTGSTFSTRRCRRGLLAPVARVMAVALDYIDCFAAAHSLASLAALEGELARL